MAITLSDFLGTKDAVTPKNQCSCPVCTGLDCLQRPRFFAGQLISDVDLNSEIDYILAKQRLHNRYLHGVGTVCGLEVVCNTCDGYVTVKPGYAISPCGDDIIVCQEQAFNVIKAISDCCTSRKTKSNCDPYQPAGDAGCTGIEQHWCVTLSYVETPSQPVTPLRSTQKCCSCSATCNCGSNGNGNGNGKKSASSCGCASNAPPPPKTATAPPSCEPTRTLESFQLGVIPDPGNCTSTANLLGNTLFANLLGCFNEISGFTSQLPTASVNVITSAIAGTLPNSQTSNTVAYTACCQFRQYVLNLFSTSSVTKCAEVAAFEALACPPLPNQDPAASDPQYLTSVQNSIDKTLKALIEAFRECICHDLLPPCAADPNGNCLILACLTIKDGKIIDICNFGCRQFAGSFPSFFYWLSLVPIVPLIKRFVTELCCGTTSDRAVGVAGDEKATTFQRTMMDSNFALPKAMFARMGDVAQKFTVEGIASGIPAEKLNLSTLRGMKAQDAVQALKTNGVSYETKTVNTTSEIPLSARSFAPFAAKGDHVIVYKSADNVVDIQAAPATTAAARSSEVADLRDQVASLRNEVESLKKTAAKRK